MTSGITELERELAEARAEVDAQKEAVDCRDRALDAANTTLARAEAEAAALRVEIGDARASLADALERIGLWSNPPHEWARDRVHNAYKTLGTCLSTTTAGAALLAERERLRAFANHVIAYEQDTDWDTRTGNPPAEISDLAERARAALAPRAEGEDGGC